MASTSRKLEVWMLHGHVSNEVVDYDELFRYVGRLGVQQRTWSDESRLVALGQVARSNRTVRITMYEGPLGSEPLIFNAAAGEERGAELSRGEIIATRTHALVDLDTREVYVEYNHRGAKARDLALVLEHAARRRRGWGDQLTLEIAPLVDESFAEAIGDFERIRTASLRLTRPNFDWTDWESSINDAAAESGAANADVSFTAGRGGSLDRDGGIISFLRNLAQARASFVKSASVTGRRQGETSETTISTQNHGEHRKVQVPRTASGFVEGTAVERELEQYRASRRTDHDGT